MVTESERRATGTWRALGVLAVLASVLAGCSSTPAAPAPSSTPPAVAAMTSRHPGCAGHTRVESDGGATCSVEGHLYVVYVLEDQAAAEQAAAAARTLHPTGTVEVDGTDVWVTE